MNEEPDQAATVVTDPTDNSGAPRPSSGAPQPSDPLAGKYPEAWRWYTRLRETIEKVTSELEAEFHAEAQRTLQVLAAAIEKFKDSTTSEPEIEVEYERLSRPRQREIWPTEFGEAAANVTAVMATLRQKAATTQTAAEGVVSQVSQAQRL
jgi:hypothetical protein